MCEGFGVILTLYCDNNRIILIEKLRYSIWIYELFQKKSKLFLLPMILRIRSTILKILNSQFYSKCILK
jgi:hypothetical protein